MENQKNNKGVIALLIVIIVILSALCVLFATGTISFNVNKGNNDDTNENVNNNTNAETDNGSNEQGVNNSELNEFVGKYVAVSSDSNDKEYFILNSDGTANIYFITGDGRNPYANKTVKYSLVTENGKKVLKFDTEYPFWNTLDAEKINNGYRFIPREVGPSAIDLTFEKNS